MGAIRDFGYGLTMQRRGDAPFLTHHPFFLLTLYSRATCGYSALYSPPCAYSFVNRRMRVCPPSIWSLTR